MYIRHINPPQRSAPYLLNFAIVLPAECAWSLGVWLANPMTVLPNFLIRLGATPAIVGLIPAFWAVGTGLGALAVGAVAAHRSRLARYTGWVHYAAALPMLGLALITLAVARYGLPPAIGLILALVCLFAFNLLMGFGLQLYFILLARLFPERQRGKWFGALFSIASLVALLGTFLASHVFIHERAELENYAALFFTSFVIVAAGTTMFFFLRERPGTALPRRTWQENLAALWAMWRDNLALRRYLIARVWLELGILTGAFFVTYSRLEGRLTEHAVTRFGTLIVLSHAGGSLLLGWLTAYLESRHHPARLTYLRAQWVTQMLALASLLFAALGPAAPAAILLAVATGLRLASEFVVHINILLETGARRLRMDMIALGAVVLMPAMLVIPPLAGLAIQWCGHRPVFLAAVLLALPGVMQLWRLCVKK